MVFHHFDLHVHTYFSDGQHNFETIIKGFIKNKIKIVGFADHLFPGCIYMHDKKEWGFSYNYRVSQLKYRKNYIRYLDKKYPQIRILNSAEIDCLPNGNLTIPKGITPDFFDYLLVVKHHTVPKPLPLFKKFPELDRWMWDHNPRLRLMKRIWKKGVQVTFEKYHPDIFGHPQEGLPKYLTREEIKWLVLQAKKNGVAFELNHLYRTTEKEQMTWLVELGQQHKVEFSLGSDFHGFTKDPVKILELLNDSQPMYEIAEQYGLKLLDPHKFLPKQ